jgi:hypothetical protein
VAVDDQSDQTDGRAWLRFSPQQLVHFASVRCSLTR